MRLSLTVKLGGSVGLNVPFHLGRKDGMWSVGLDPKPFGTVLDTLDPFATGKDPPIGAGLAGVCRPMGALWATWGTGLYHLSSTLCPAAVHAGRITLDGGPIQIVVKAGPPEFTRSVVNGHDSYFHGNRVMEKAFAFVP